ncbi:hypothetical protein [Rhodohalobacter mucosus]|uniref:FlgN protein n=1 Tax=Rhodohalobacter mucosus TaxID=2079485 RepID=A0A316TKX7_9BACT|nr:hypothetical protein [Rhodohalobacter mucosus]PWN05207.1 hypothetical protein DDZ15_15900 [Rhodohalobacter mucosus]
MVKLYKELENMLSTGYHILDELESDDPEISRIEELYNSRSKQLDSILSDWNGQNAQMVFTEEDGITPKDFRNLFYRLNLLERELDRSLKSLQKQKTDVLRHLDSFRTANKAYQQPGSGSSSIFLDVNSTY